MKINGICVVTFPITDSVALSNLMNIFRSFKKNLFLISGDIGYSHFKNDNKIIAMEIHHKKFQNPISRLIDYLIIQIRISLKILKAINKIEILIFFIGGDTLFLPILISRIMQKKVLLLIAGSSIITLKSKKDSFYSGLKLLHIFTCLFANKIILYSNLLIANYKLKRWENKILIAHRHFLDFPIFTGTTLYHDRPNLIGYIGRLSGEKGVQHFTQALPAILSNNQDLRVLIGGDGQLKGAIEASLQDGSIADRVDLPGWISHDELPKYLNQLRLLVLPSYTEGLPNIMLEAMACGTPVLATPVGAIPDVIRDGETGFIMEDNTPDCIARNVMRALNDPDLEDVAERGRRFVEGEYTFEKVVERWKGVLEEI